MVQGEGGDARGMTRARSRKGGSRLRRWADGKGATVPAALQAYRQRLDARPAVQLALRHEGLDAK